MINDFGGIRSDVIHASDDEQFNDRSNRLEERHNAIVNAMTAIVNAMTAIVNAVAAIDIRLAQDLY